MTVDPNSIDLPAFMTEHLQRAEPDLLRSMLSTFVQALMSAEADAICGAAYGERSPERTNSRNGYRTRDFDTRTGTMEVAIPKLREGSYFPDWLLERRRRAEQLASQRDRLLHEQAGFAEMLSRSEKGLVSRRAGLSAAQEAAAAAEQAFSDAAAAVDQGRAELEKLRAERARADEHDARIR